VGAGVSLGGRRRREVATATEGNVGKWEPESAAADADGVRRSQGNVGTWEGRVG